MEHSDNQPYKFAVHHSEEEGKKTRKMIWKMFWVLLAITAVEVLLGMYWKNIGVAWDAVKITFIVLTVAKAYFIVAYYMHLKHEWSTLRNIIIAPFALFALYILYHLIGEAVYHEHTLHWFF